MPITISGTTGIAGVDGSAGTPAVQGTDTNTGEFFPAADTIAWTTGGSERMRINSSGDEFAGGKIGRSDNVFNASHIYKNGSVRRFHAFSRNDRQLFVRDQL
jgi:hypothetical protein